DSSLRLQPPRKAVQATELVHLQIIEQVELFFEQVAVHEVNYSDTHARCFISVGRPNAALGRKCCQVLLDECTLARPIHTDVERKYYMGTLTNNQFRANANSFELFQFLKQH